MRKTKENIIIIMISVFMMFFIGGCALFNKSSSLSSGNIADNEIKYLSKKAKKQRKSSIKASEKAYNDAVKRHNKLQTEITRDRMRAMNKRSKKLNKYKKLSFSEKRKTCW